MVFHVIKRFLKRDRQMGQAAASGQPSTSQKQVRRRLRLRHLACRWLRLTSPCEGAVSHTVPIDDDGSWRTFCGVCKRPVEAKLGRALPAAPPAGSAHWGPRVAGSEGDVHQATSSAAARGRFAYVVVIWGSSPGYVLGAMVLASSLRQQRTPHDLVLLHTSNVPKGAVALLARAGWSPREVEPVTGVRELYSHGEPRFQGVFTKLRVLGLLEYEKVLCMDIDTLVLKSMDSLFDLPAPAANGRGPQDEYCHGDLINGTYFFRGSGSKKSWGQCWGINAGVMLLQPSEDHLQQTISEVVDSWHPSHIKGNGPEQDYLSRYWASSWTHIGVEYNFQLHQMYHVLHPRGGERDLRCKYMLQFLQDPSKSDIHLMHYSGSLKPWARFLEPKYSMDNSGKAGHHFVRDTLESFQGYWLWAKRDPEMVQGKGWSEGVALGPNGKLHWIDFSNEAPSADVKMDGNAGELSFTKQAEAPSVRLAGEVDIPDELVRAAEFLVEHSIDLWMEAYNTLSKELRVDNLAAEVAQACAGAEASTSTADDSTWSKSSKTASSDTGWRKRAGWWSDRPVRERLSVAAGSIPEPFVVLSVQCQAVLSLRGRGAFGLHLLALPCDGDPPLQTTLQAAPSESLDLGELASWVSKVPLGSCILAAFLGLLPISTEQVLKILMDAGFGNIPNSAAPAECGVLVLAGRRGKGEYYQTMAAPDFAIASLPCNLSPPSTIQS